jgi:SWI/SNF-related matrix-associated actin-dependent regulator of chromatin subfamily A member 5
MKSYQLSGLSYLVWLYKNGVSGILGDEMGLGKTLQTLSLFSYLTTYEPTPPGHQRPFLVVCPLSVLSSWMAECKRWTPHLRALRFHGPTTERARLKKVAETGELLGIDDSEGEGRGYDIVVTSYEVFEREKAWFRRAFVWRYVVVSFFVVSFCHRVLMTKSWTRVTKSKMRRQISRCLCRDWPLSIA